MSNVITSKFIKYHLKDIPSLKPFNLTILELFIYLNLPKNILVPSLKFYSDIIDLEDHKDYPLDSIYNKEEINFQSSRIYLNENCKRPGPIVLYNICIYITCKMVMDSAPSLLGFCEVLSLKIFVMKRAEIVVLKRCNFFFEIKGEEIEENVSFFNRLLSCFVF